MFSSNHAWHASRLSLPEANSIVKLNSISLVVFPSCGTEILLNEMDDNCIEEIVSFCVGKVSKFQIAKDEIMTGQNEDLVMIDDTRNVAQKDQ